MSMLGTQVDELRKMAAAMSERGSAIGLDYGMGRGFVDAARMMREAADTITILSDKLQGVIGTRYYELFGTPERAAQLIADNCEYLDYCGQCWMRAANCDGKYSTVLEWLRDDAE